MPFQPAFVLTIIMMLARAVAALTGRFGASVKGYWVFSTQYPRHKLALSEFIDSLTQTHDHK